MNKSELATHVADRLCVSKATADAVVSAVFATIGEALAREDTVSITGFGTFVTRARAAREGRNPATGQRIQIAASKTPAFKPGKTLRNIVNAGT